MAFDFDNLKKKVQDVAFAAGEKAQEVAAVASEKAQDVAERAKIEYAIAAEKHSIEKNYRAIGEWYVSTVETAPDAVADIVAAVRASQAKIAELEAGKDDKDAPVVEATAVEVEPEEPKAE